MLLKSDPVFPIFLVKKSNLLPEIAKSSNLRKPDLGIQFCPDFVDVKKFLPKSEGVPHCVLLEKLAIDP